MERKFTGHLALKLRPSWWDKSTEQRRAAVDEMVQLFERFPGQVCLRGAYLTQGFRADTDLLLWMIADEFDIIQELELAVRRTAFGRAADVAWAFAGVTADAEFNKQHLPAFLRGIPPKRYICFYPFIRTPEWYVLEAEERAQMLGEHGRYGREFPDILTNGVYAFGLGDYEWLLSFETDNLAELAHMVRRQREARARLYTKHEWPFIVGRRFDLQAALEQLI